MRKTLICAFLNIVTLLTMSASSVFADSTQLTLPTSSATLAEGPGMATVIEMHVTPKGVTDPAQPFGFPTVCPMGDAYIFSKYDATNKQVWYGCIHTYAIGQANTATFQTEETQWVNCSKTSSQAQAYYAANNLAGGEICTYSYQNGIPLVTVVNNDCNVNTSNQNPDATVSNQPAGNYCWLGVELGLTDANGNSPFPMQSPPWRADYNAPNIPAVGTFMLPPPAPGSTTSGVTYQVTLNYHGSNWHVYCEGPFTITPDMAGKTVECSCNIDHLAGSYTWAKYDVNGNAIPGNNVLPQFCVAQINSAISAATGTTVAPNAQISFGQYNYPAVQTVAQQCIAGYQSAAIGTDAYDVQNPISCTAH